MKLTASIMFHSLLAPIQKLLFSTFRNSDWLISKTFNSKSYIDISVSIEKAHLDESKKK